MDIWLQTCPKRLDSLLWFTKTFSVVLGKYRLCVYRNFGFLCVVQDYMARIFKNWEIAVLAFAYYLCCLHARSYLQLLNQRVSILNYVSPSSYSSDSTFLNTRKHEKYFAWHKRFACCTNLHLLVCYILWNSRIFYFQKWLWGLRYFYFPGRVTLQHDDPTNHCKLSRCNVASL